MRVLIALALSSTTALACPPVADTAGKQAELQAQLLDAPSEEDAQQIAGQIWMLWLTAPDGEAQFLLDRAIERREAWDWAMAERILDDLVDYCPHYTEAFNQRAFVRYLREDYERALEDIAVVLAENPYHFGALSGKALVLMRQGDIDGGQQVLRQALVLNPWLNERHMLIPTYDKDI